MRTYSRLALAGVVLAAVTLSACGADHSRQLIARFVSAAPLVDGNQVKLKGVVVGKIESMRVSHGKAEVTMSLDPEAFPLHSDATFTIRPASLLGERYVDIDRGSPSAPALDMSRVVPVAQTATNVGLDEVLNTMDDPTSEGLAMLVTTLGTGVRGNGQRVDDTITSLAPDMKQINALTALLKNHNELLGALVEDAKPIVGAVADQDGQTLDRLVDSSDRLLAATSADQEDLRQTLDKLPGALSSGRKTLNELDDTADAATPTLKALKPFTKNIPDIADELDDFSDALDPALDSARPVLRSADELLNETRRPADDLRVASPLLESTVHDTVPIVHGLTVDRNSVFAFIRNWALNNNGFDGLSHYWRVNLTLSNEMWTGVLARLGVGGPSTSTTSTPADTAATSDGAATPGPKSRLPEIVNGVTQPLKGLTDKLKGGSLLKPKSTPDGGNTGLDKKQESSLLGFLLGGGK